MALRKYKPTTPSQRQLVLVDRSTLYKGKPVKQLTEGKNASGGRNNHGRTTVRFRGGGHKQAYRAVDFKRRKFDVNGRIERIEYDPNRTAFIALLKYDDGELAYILAPQRLAEGDIIVAGEHVDVKPGNAMPLGNMPVGTIVHNIELKIGKGGQLARTAGSSAQVVAKEGDYVTLRLRSSEMRLIHGRCLATVGEVGNAEHELLSVGKAGKSRWLGKRPKVRGVAMNPVDHPLGGGEGKSSGGRPPTSPWGKVEGKKTRHRKKHSTKMIVRGRKRGRATT
jgi:large subunit ribosomal protein L2